MNKYIKEKLLLFRITSRKDPEAYGKVYDEYVNRIYRFIYFKVSGEEEARDLVSETFLRAWQYLQEGKQIKQLSSFLYKIARNLVIDHYRKKAMSVLTESELPAAMFGDEGRQGKEIETKHDFGLLLAAMNKMKEEYREVVQLKYIDGLSVGEIADILDKNRGAVRVTLHRASKTLRELMNKS
ncbi:RNA polymerase sigma factor [Candidatus Uhrbacteria bacterium]|nr:RNA polymerase sigma factor [Candidatus Uhrbacteria bacterium]